MNNTAPNVLFLSHGGGPLPLLGDEGHREMLACLREIAARLPRPAAILVISAHWEQDVPTITSGARPELIYDYYGFPEAAYHIRYPCPGEPRLAQAVQDALGRAGLEARLDDRRGFDHGLFVPLKLMYPQADIPCVQLSLVSSLDAALHVDIGSALRNLAADNLLVIGSGFSFHNMRAFFGAQSDESRAKNEAFDLWLRDTCGNVDISEPERRQRLIDWTQAPAARYCHPREEHLLPLQVCYGLAARAATEVHALRILDKQASMVLWAEKRAAA